MEVGVEVELGVEDGVVVDSGDAVVDVLRGVRRVAYTDSDGDAARPDGDLARALPTNDSKPTDTIFYLTFTAQWNK